MPEALGIDHIYITVSDLPRAVAFYDLLLRDILRFRKGGVFQLDGDEHHNYYNRHFGFVLRPARTSARVDPYAPGLHHFCFRVDTAEDVDEVATQLRARGVDASEPRLYPDYAPDYFATFFRDPDGLRLEVTNYRAERRQRYQHWDNVR